MNHALTRMLAALLSVVLLVDTALAHGGSPRSSTATTPGRGSYATQAFTLPLAFGPRLLERPSRSRPAASSVAHQANLQSQDEFLFAPSSVWLLGVGVAAVAVIAWYAAGPAGLIAVGAAAAVVAPRIKLNKITPDLLRYVTHYKHGKPTLTLAMLALAIGHSVQAYPTLEDAVLAGWLKADYPDGAGPGQDLFRADKLVSIRDKFVLRAPPVKGDELLNALQMSKALGKDVNRVNHMVEVGIITPFQTIWEEKSHQTHYFLKSDLERYKRQVAPEMVSNSMATLTLSDRKHLNLPERFIAFAIADKQIRPSRIGPPGNPHYLVTASDLIAFKKRLQRKWPKRLLSLPVPRGKVLDQTQLAEEFGITPGAARDLFTRHEIEPAFIVGQNDRNTTFFVWKKKLPLYRKVFAPWKVKFAKKAEDLAKPLDLHPSRLVFAFNDGLVNPVERVGSHARPYYVMTPKAMAAGYKALHPLADYTSITALGDQEGFDRGTVLLVVKDARIPVRAWAHGEIVHLYVHKSHVPTVIKRLPKRIGKGFISQSEVVRRLKINEERMQGIPGDDGYRIGANEYKFYKEAGVPKNPANRAAIKAWLERYRQKVKVLDTKKTRRARLAAWLLPLFLLTPLNPPSGSTSHGAGFVALRGAA